MTPKATCNITPLDALRKLKAHHESMRSMLDSINETYAKDTPDHNRWVAKYRKDRQQVKRMIESIEGRIIYDFDPEVNQTALNYDVHLTYL